MSTGTASRPYDNFCQHCGTPLQGDTSACGNCGTRLSPAPVIVTLGRQNMTPAEQQEVDRGLIVAWSCLKDVEGKVREIRQAKAEQDREVKDGTFRGTLSASARRGRLESEFHDSLNIALKSAMKAQEIDPGRSVSFEGGQITPNLIFGTVCCFRGDLQFALEQWDAAISFYNHALQYAPEDATCFYNIGAAYTNKHEPARAIEAFRRVVQLDPTGSYGIEASKTIQKLTMGALGQKQFTGSWGILAVLGGLVLLSLFTANINSGTGMQYFMFWGGILALYWWRKYK